MSKPMVHCNNSVEKAEKRPEEHFALQREFHESKPKCPPADVIYSEPTCTSNEDEVGITLVSAVEQPTHKSANDEDWFSESRATLGFLIHEEDCRRFPAVKATHDYVHHAYNMRDELQEEQADLRVQQYAIQVKQFFLKLDPRRAKAFVLALTGDEHGDWRQLFTHLAAIPDQPAKRRNPSYEKSKAYARTLRATRNYERAIDAGRKAYDRAKDWSAFLDKRSAQTPALPPAKTPKALTIGESA